VAQAKLVEFLKEHRERVSNNGNGEVSAKMMFGEAAAVHRLAESSLIGVWFGVTKLSRGSCYKSNLMKKPIYAALDPAQPHERAGQYGSRRPNAAADAFCY
jgi:hypothetical protein